MKQNKYVKRSGPFKVSSISQDGRGVRLVVYPAFPDYGPDWEIGRLSGEGGGPGIFTAMATATEMEEFLNQSYTEAEVTQWKETLAKALEPQEKKDRARIERRMRRLEKASND